MLTTGWANSRFAVLDLETTGLDVENDLIVSAALVSMDPARGSTETLSWLVDPWRRVPGESTAIHGITTDDVREDGVPAPEAVERIHTRLRQAWRAGPVLVFNAPFDLSMLDRETRRHLGHGLEIGPVIDPLVCDRALDPYRPGRGTRQLRYLCHHVYEVPFDETDGHTAAGDALATGLLAREMSRRHPELMTTDLDLLHHRQDQWYREWARDFSDYLVRMGRPDNVPRDWPLIPAPEPVRAPTPEPVTARHRRP